MLNGLFNRFLVVQDGFSLQLISPVIDTLMITLEAFVIVSPRHSIQVGAANSRLASSLSIGVAPPQLIAPPNGG